MQSRVKGRIARIVGVALMVPVLVGGIIGYSYLKPTADASGQITAIALTPSATAGDQVAGQLLLDLTELDAARIGAIQINARTFATDSAQRDRAVQDRILLTDQHEYITFAPTDVTGLSAALPVGEPVTCTVDGDLAIRDVTRPVTFAVTLTPVTTDRLAGSATTTIAFADWGISIPSVPFVTGLGTTVTLALDFEAAA